MNTILKVKIVRLIAIISLITVACSSGPSGVASFKDANAVGDPKETKVTDAETAWLAFTQCLRDNGLNVKDPVVDSDGSVSKPEPVEGANIDKKEWEQGYDVCGKHIERVTTETKEGTGKKMGSIEWAEYVDRLLKIAACLRDQGIKVDDPDASAGDPGRNIGAQLKENWESPAIKKAREVCDVNAAFGIGDKD